MNDNIPGSRAAALSVSPFTDPKAKRPGRAPRPSPTLAAHAAAAGIEATTTVASEKEMAQRLGVPMKTLRGWRYAGRLEGTYAVWGHHILYRPELLVAKLFAAGGAA